MILTIHPLIAQYAYQVLHTFGPNVLPVGPLFHHDSDRRVIGRTDREMFAVDARGGFSVLPPIEGLRFQPGYLTRLPSGTMYGVGSFPTDGPEPSGPFILLPSHRAVPLAAFGRGGNLSLTDGEDGWLYGLGMDERGFSTFAPVAQAPIPGRPSGVRIVR